MAIDWEVLLILFLCLLPTIILIIYGIKKLWPKLFRRPPNIEELKAKMDIEGLIKVLKIGNDWYMKDWDEKDLQKDLEIIHKTAEALVQVGKPAVESLIRVLEDTDFIYCREEAIWALAKIEDARAVKPLSQVLMDEDKSVRTHAAKVLVKRGDAWVAKPLIQALRNDYYDVRENAAEALVKVGKPAVKPLIQALRYKNEHTRSMVAYALGNIGDARAVDHLIKALEVGVGDYFPTAAAEALGKLKDKRAVEPLVQAMKNNHIRIEEAAMALEKLDWRPGNDEEKSYYLIAKEQWEELAKLGKSAVKPLIQAFEEAREDDDEFVQESAIGALKKIGTMEARQAIAEYYQMIEEEKAEMIVKEMGEVKYTCGMCGMTCFIGPPDREGYAGFGQCPKCQRILCSNCYVRSAGEVFGIMVLVNQCPECKATLEPPPGV